MKLSVIVPVLNEARQLPVTLAGLLPLMRQGTEVIIADGGSEDGSAAVAERAGFTVVRAAHGRARQMNAGAALATGDVLIFLHADTQLPEDAEISIVRALADNRFSWGRFDVRISGRPFMLRVVSRMMNLRSRLTGIATGDQAMFVTRTAFDAAGGFPDQPLMEDIELSSRLLSAFQAGLYRAMRDHFGPSLGNKGRMAHDFADVAAALGLLARRTRAAIGRDLSMSGVRVVIFAKAPQPGMAKTRLIPTLGAQGAADLARRMLSHTLAQALAAGVGPVELCVTPSPIETLWQSLTIPASVAWSDQGEGDLGARMARATQRVIGAGESVLIIGTDCPELDAGHLRRAAMSLKHFDATLVPTADGGYVLLGLNRFHASVFADIEWSTHSVAAETLSRLEQLGWKVQNNPMLHDIDEPADLGWLPPAWLGTANEREANP